MTAAPEPDAQPVTDLDAAVTFARDTLDRLPAALANLYHDRHSHDWTPETTGARRTPASRPLWEATTTIGHAYHRAIAHLARANHALLYDTDAPEPWLAHSIVGRPVDPASTGRWGTDTSTCTARTVSLAEARLACMLTSAALEWLRAEHRNQRLMPPEVNAALHACAEVDAAWEAIPDGFRHVPIDDRRRCKRQGCEGADGRPRPAAPKRTQCWACIKREQRQSVA